MKSTSLAKTRWHRAGTSALRSGGAFSLVEVVIALGLVSFALIAILGLILVGMSSLKESVADTSTSLLALNVRETLVGKRCEAGALGPFYYDASTRYQAESPDADSFYRVDVTLAPPSPAIPDTKMLVASVVITWPTGPTGEQGAQRFQTSFFVTPVTGAGWKSLDAAFVPKIGL